MGYQLETTVLNYKDNYNAFRIRRIMLILENIKNVYIYNPETDKSIKAHTQSLYSFKVIRS